MQFEFDIEILNKNSSLYLNKGTFKLSWVGRNEKKSKKISICFFFYKTQFYCLSSTFALSSSSCKKKYLVDHNFKAILITFISLHISCMIACYWIPAWSPAQLPSSPSHASHSSPIRPFSFSPGNKSQRKASWAIEQCLSFWWRQNILFLKLFKLKIFFPVFPDVQPA